MTKPSAIAVSSVAVLFIVFLLGIEWSPHIPDHHGGEGFVHNAGRQAGKPPEEACNRHCTFDQPDINKHQYFLFRQDIFRLRWFGTATGNN
jgi:hypothetical protein